MYHNIPGLEGRQRFLKLYSLDCTPVCCGHSCVLHLPACLPVKSGLGHSWKFRGGAAGKGRISERESAPQGYDVHNIHSLNLPFLPGKLVSNLEINCKLQETSRSQLEVGNPTTLPTIKNKEKNGLLKWKVWAKRNALARCWRKNKGGARQALGGRVCRRLGPMGREDSGFAILCLLWKCF